MELGRTSGSAPGHASCRAACIAVRFSVHVCNDQEQAAQPRYRDGGGARAHRGLGGGRGDTGDGAALGGGSARPSPTRRRASIVGEVEGERGAGTTTRTDELDRGDLPASPYAERGQS
jgi:hypothetical protein